MGRDKPGYVGVLSDSLTPVSVRPLFHVTPPSTVLEYLLVNRFCPVHAQSQHGCYRHEAVRSRINQPSSN